MKGQILLLQALTAAMGKKRRCSEHTVLQMKSQETVGTKGTAVAVP